MTLSEIGDSEGERTPPGSPVAMADGRRKSRAEGESKRRHTEGDVHDLCTPDQTEQSGMGLEPLKEAKSSTTNKAKSKKKGKEKRSKTTTDERVDKRATTPPDSHPAPLHTRTPPAKTVVEDHCEPIKEGESNEPLEDAWDQKGHHLATPPTEAPVKIPSPVEPVPQSTLAAGTSPTHSPLRLGKNMLRVGLSRRSRVEPLHAYLKK